MATHFSLASWSVCVCLSLLVVMQLDDLDSRSVYHTVIHGINEEDDEDDEVRLVAAVGVEVARAGVRQRRRWLSHVSSVPYLHLLSGNVCLSRSACLSCWAGGCVCWLWWSSRRRGSGSSRVAAAASWSCCLPCSGWLWPRWGPMCGTRTAAASAASSPPPWPERRPSVSGQPASQPAAADTGGGADRTGCHVAL